MGISLVNVGKSKVFYYDHEKDRYIMRFLDNICARGGEKKDRIVGTGILRGIVSEYIFKLLEKNGISTHYIKTISPGLFEVKNLQMFKLEIIPRNFAAGSACVRYPLPKGYEFIPPILKIDMKYGFDPMLNTDYILAMGLATKKELNMIRKLAMNVNEIIKKDFYEKDLLLVDFKFEVGKDKENNIIIGDEISCDGFRVWDKNTYKSLDKDVFRYDLGNILETYKLLCSRINPNFDADDFNIFEINHI